jgi:hypothetical protein
MERKKVTPLDELLEVIDKINNDDLVAAKLVCDVRFINQWKPRKRTMPNGSIYVEAGCSPSSGFIAVAIALLS